MKISKTFRISILIIFTIFINVAVCYRLQYHYLNQLECELLYDQINLINAKEEKIPLNIFIEKIKNNSYYKHEKNECEIQLIHQNCLRCILDSKSKKDMSECNCGITIDY